MNLKCYCILPKRKQYLIYKNPKLQGKQNKEQQKLKQTQQKREKKIKTSNK